MTAGDHTPPTLQAETPGGFPRCHPASEPTLTTAGSANGLQPHAGPRRASHAARGRVRADQATGSLSLPKSSEVSQGHPAVDNGVAVILLRELLLAFFTFGSTGI